jgi:hypothetical protein
VILGAIVIKYGDIEEVIQVNIQLNEKHRPEASALEMETKNLVFPAVATGESSCLVFRIFNRSNKIQLWSFSSASPPYLRFNESGNVSKRVNLTRFKAYNIIESLDLVQ